MGVLNIADHRKAIDKLDEQLVRLLSERTRHVLAIGAIKHASGDEIYAPHRERAVLDRVAKLNPGPMTTEQVQAIYREIMSGALALEKTLSIAYPGPESGLSHKAALRRFGSSLKYIPFRTQADVFTAVQAGRADYGVVPMEASANGRATRSLELFIDSDLKIVSQIILAGSSTKAARYLVLGRQCSPPTGRDRTSLILSMRDKTAATRGVMDVFRRAKIDLLTVEAFASKRKGWRNLVFIDCNGHAQEKNLTRAIRNLTAYCNSMKILGSYPNAE